VLRATTVPARCLSRGFCLAATAVEATKPSVVIPLLAPSAPNEEVDNAEIAASPSPNAGVCAPPPTPVGTVGTPPEQPAPRNTPTATPVFSTARWRQKPYRRTLASAASSPKCPQCRSWLWS